MTGPQPLLWAPHSSHNMTDAITLCLSLTATLLLLWAAAHDMIARTIPDCLSLALAGLGFLLHCLSGDFSRLLAAMATAATVGLLAALCWLRGWLGGGDAKLFAAVAVLLPPPEVPIAIAAAMLAGGPLALVYAAAANRVPVPSRQRTTLLGRAARAEAWRLTRGGPLPYAVAIAVGTLAVLVSSDRWP